MTGTKRISKTSRQLLVRTIINMTIITFVSSGHEYHILNYQSVIMIMAGAIVRESLEHSNILNLAPF